MANTGQMRASWSRFLAEIKLTRYIYIKVLKVISMKFSIYLVILIGCLFMQSCDQDNGDKEETEDPKSSFYFGADLSYVNQILDHQGIYKDQGEQRSPYRIFKDHGANLVRLRLWHNPSWTKEVYSPPGLQMYNDIKDVEKAIRLSKDQQMQVLLDFHYSDSWADPGKQEIPKAWLEIKDINVLKDSVYQYTFKTLKYLDSKGLMPELIQIGNETNCGLLYTNATSGFPTCNVCNGEWQRLGIVINSAIQAVNDANTSSQIKPKIILHVADPKNVEWWFDNITGAAQVSNFDVVGFSFYPIWHTTVTPDKISESVSKFKTKYNKDVMVLETAYPWTSGFDDNYNNQFGGETPLPGYPYTVEGQTNMLKKITAEIIEGGGIGIVYWEPAWISSAMKDKWGTGSSWENTTFFDFEGNVITSIDFMQHEYE